MSETQQSGESGALVTDIVRATTEDIECGFCADGVEVRFIGGREVVGDRPCPYCNGRGYVNEEHHGY